MGTEDLNHNVEENESPPEAGEIGSSQETDESQAGETQAGRRLDPEEDAPASARFPIVGIGASAGGLKAFEQFFKNMPENSGMAFVLIQHLAPHHESELAELLQNHTRMKVTQIEDEPEVRPNHVYVIPPGKSLAIKEGVLRLSEPKRRRGRRAPIDFFFRSLAEDQGENAVCIVLSGTGADGTLGLKAVKERAGVTMAQTPKDAEYDGMPRSAVNTGLVDLEGTAAELAQKLLEYKKNASKIQVPEKEEALLEDDSEALTQIFTQLRSKTGHDFTHYKRSTVLRRLGRRLQVNQIESIPKYLAYLRHNPEESLALFKDFLISVTNFFRDPEAFDALEKKVIPSLFRTKGRSDQVRVWVAGSATGEEAYSVAILLCEYAAELDESPDLQLFATDIDEEAIAFAREGLYPDSIAADITPERLKRFFKEEAGGYRVKKEIREVVLFAGHNLIKDPPFSRLDLITCRNLLIYLNRDVQEKIFELFHYAMRPGGYLFLGSSESTDAASNLFTPRSKKQRLFKRRDAVSTTSRFPPVPSGKSVNGSPPQAKAAAGSDEPSLEEMYQAWVLKRYGPPRLIVNDHYQITHIFGGADRYLQEREGPVTQNILHKIWSALRLDLRAALYQAFQKGERVESRFLRVDLEEETRLIKLHVGPIEEPGFPQEYIEVVFEEQPVVTLEPLDLEAEDAADEAELISRLEEEVQRTRERLQATIEEYETSNEELKASNEELQSMNEELQSTTEELETSKEELQSTNEELITVNQELKNKIEELNQVNSDLQNLMVSTEIAVLFLDRRLHVKRYTPRVKEIFNIISSDIGRPFAHISHSLEIDDLPEMADRVLKKLSSIEQEVKSESNRWYIARLLPYRTMDDKIDGVVLTFVEVTALKETQQQLKQRSRQQATAAGLGQIALTAMPPADLLATAARRVAEALEVEFGKVLEYRPESKDFLLKAGFGWPEEMVGQATVETASASQAGYTLQAGGPVIVEDLAGETRFTGPALLTDHGVVSGLSVVIWGNDDRPYGILGAHSRSRRSFTQDDVHFIQSVANILAEAIDRVRREESLRHSRETVQQQLAEIEAIYNTAPVGLAFFDPALRFLRLNDRLAEINGLPVADHLGRTGPDLFPDLHPQIKPYMERALKGEPVLDAEIHGATPARPDRERDWLVSYVPVRDRKKRIIGVNTVVQEITDRKQAERERERLLAQVQAAQDEAEAERRRLHDLFMQAPAFIAMHQGPDHIYIFSNNLHDNVVGRRDLIGQPLQEAMPELAGQGVFERFDKVFATGEPHFNPEFEAVFDRDGDGRPERSYFSQVLQPIRNAAGSIEGVISFAYEITEQVETRRQLEETSAELAGKVIQLEAVLAGMSEGLVLADPAGFLLNMNPAALALHDFAGVEEARLHLADYPALFELFELTGEPLPVETWPLAAALAGERFHDREVRVRRQDTGREWIGSYSGTPVYDPQGEMILAILTIRDITVQKEAEAALRASEARFRRAILDAPFPITLHAEDGEILLMSKAITALTGYTPDEIPTIDAWVERAYGRERRADIRKSVERLYRLDQAVDEGEFTIITKSGERRIWRFSSAPVGSDERDRRLVISMAADITHRRKAEESLQKNQQRLQDLNETLEQRVVERTAELSRTAQELDQFTYVASHDLKTPLRAIDNLAAWIAEDALDFLPEDSREHLEKLRERVKRMETLLDDLLAYSRAGRHAVEVEPVDTEELVSRVAEMLALPASFSLTIQEKMPTLTTSRPLLEMVFRNLIDNAVKHHDRPEGRISVTAREDEEKATFAVADDGPGIAETYHDRIFQIFQTLQSKDKGGGSGLGLAIVKKIVEGQGGEIHLETGPERGTTFCFTWPK